MCIFQSGVGGAPAADSRFAVPCPSDRNALRNPLRKHAPTVTGNPKVAQTQTLIDKLV